MGKCRRFACLNESGLAIWVEDSWLFSEERATVAGMTFRLSRPGPLRALVSRVRLATIRHAREPRVPLLAKAPLLAAVYLTSPVIVRDR